MTEDKNQVEQEEIKEESPADEAEQELNPEQQEPQEQVEDLENKIFSYAEVKPLIEENADFKDKLVRALAENENLRKRQERELANAYKFATERLIKDLLPVLDALTLGLKSAQENQEKPEAIKQFIEGSQMTLKILLENLAKNGVEEINPVGEKFNPEFHEALTMLPNPELENNSIIDVAQKGYLLNGRTIRAAQVVVVKNS